MQAYGVNYLKNEWRAADASVQKDIDFLNTSLKGQWFVQSQTRNGRIWVVGNDPVTAPVRAMLYDRDAKTLTELYVGRPALVGKALPAMCPVQIRSRDGLTLVSYLTLPVGSDAAYHWQKAQDADHLVNIWGADHAGTVKRVQSAVKALTARISSTGLRSGFTSRCWFG